MAAGAPRAGVFFRPNHRAVKQTSHAAYSVAPFFLPRRQGRKAPWSPGERPAPGKTRAAGAPEAPACRNPGQPGDQDAMAPRRPGRISWPGDQAAESPEARRPRCRMTGGPETRMANDRRPGDQGGEGPETRMAKSRRPGDQETRVANDRRPGDPETRVTNARRPGDPETRRPGGIQTKQR